MRKRQWVLGVIALFFSNAFADGDHAAPKGSSRVGLKMAVTEFDHHEGFKLSDRAMQTLGVAFTELGSGSSWMIPKEAVVKIKKSTGVYRRNDGWIRFAPIEITQSHSNTVTIRSDELEAQDEIAIRGTTALRLTEADLEADTVDSCSH